MCTKIHEMFWEIFRDEIPIKTQKIFHMGMIL